ncbi:hypothetical protein HNV12_08420 [Methanococcoides sp. SA1]|nr:hypothetical protein [Methanococcoides sp. SA1]
MTAMLPALAGANIVYGSGMLEMGQTVSFEQLVVDNDIIAMIDRLLGGVRVSGADILMDDIKSVGIGKHFLGLASTRNGMSAQSDPVIFDRSTRGDWEHQGAKDAAQVAHEKVNWILENHDPCGLDGDIVKDLNSFVATKDKDLVRGD